MAHWEHMQELRDFIAKLPNKACDMTDWFRIAVDDDGQHVTFSVMKERGFQCGSAACLSGWAEMIANQATSHELVANNDVVGITSEDWLELTGQERNDLFCAFPDDTPDEGWRSWMVDRLDHAIANREITPYYEVEDDDYDEDGVDAEE